MLVMSPPARLVRFALAATVCAALCAIGVQPLHAQDEVRALWVVRTSLTSVPAIESVVAAAKANGFNTLLVQVRGRGDAYYQQGLEPRPAALESRPDFDPLLVTIQRAHDAGLQVHAWINVNLIASVTELPASRDHVIYRHPEWLMVPRTLGEDLASVDPRSPEYLGRLARYVRGQPAELEGLYLSPMSDGAAAYTVSVVRDIAQRYAVDGVHLDYIRYPTDEFDYGREALEGFRRDVITDLTPAEQSRYDVRLPREPLLYTQAFPERWRRFRTSRLTTLVASLKDAVKSARPSATVSAAVQPDAVEALTRRFQDWREWLRRDLIDVICPMVYTTDATLFASQVAQAREMAGRHPLWAGIGAYRLSSDQILNNIETARRAGVGGIILFSYDSLVDPLRGPGYLAQIGRGLLTR